MLLDNNGIRVDTEKVEILHDKPKPKFVTDVLTFLKHYSTFETLSMNLQ